MKKNMNYITALPDFIEMQRISFCWFIAEGLKDELTNFSSILDFSGNIEYVFFGQEYKLVKPVYNASSAKRYTSNYVAQLIMPIEMRNKRTNTSMRQGRLPLANLPLMTTAATFIINGCERIIVSQVIRSPGVYFEKNKKQKRRKLNKLTLSNDFHKVRPFTQTSFGILKNPNIISLSPIFEKPNFSYNTHRVEYTNHCLNFIEFFKVYTIVSKTLTNKSKSQRIKNFLRLLNTFKSQLVLQIDTKNETPSDILDYLSNLLKSVIKYQILQTFTNDKELRINDKSLFSYHYVNKHTQLLYENKIKRINRLLTKRTLNFDKLTETYKKQIGLDPTFHFNQLDKVYQDEIDIKYFNLWQQKINKYNKIINLYERKTKRFLISDPILVFHKMAAGGGGVDLQTLSDGIFTAMVTTVAGLIVGIIAYVGYNTLVARVEKIVFVMEARTVEFLDILHEPAV